MEEGSDISWNYFIILDFFSYSIFLMCLYMKLKLSFQFLGKIMLKFWWGLHSVIRCYVIWCLSMSKEIFAPSSWTSFFNLLKFVSFKSFTSIVRVSPRYFILFEAILTGVSLTTFSVCFSFVYRRISDF